MNFSSYTNYNKKNMMQNSCSSSCNSIISITSYSSFNNYSNQRYPLNYCSCCCSFPVNYCKLLVPTISNPSYCLYGLRQSTLIQCPPSRRLVLGSSDHRYVAWSSNCDVGRCCCSDSSSGKQERVDNCVGKGKSVDVDRIKSRMSRPKRDLRSNALGDAEAMLSLLSEGMVEECGIGREKKWSAFPERNVGSKPSAVIEKLKDRKPNLCSGCRLSDPKSHQLESYRVPSREEGPKRDKEREDVPKDEDRRLRCREPRITQSVEIEKFKDRKQNVDSPYRESELKNHELETYRVPSREVGRKREEEREFHSKNEDQRSRRRESSSSYFSLSDSEDYDSDVEAELSQEHFVGESLVSHKKDSRKSGGVVISEKTEKDWEKCRDEKKQVLQKNARDNVRVGGSIQHDWRKKSEKKLTEESDVKSFGHSSSQFVKDNRASMYSKSNSQHVHSKQTSRDDVETSSTWKRTSQGNDSKIVGKFQETGCDYCETCGRSMEEKKTQSYIQHHADRSETSIDAELTVSGEHVSESNRHRKHEKSSGSIQSSAAEEIKQHGQIHIVTGQSDTKRDSLHYQDGDQMSANDSWTKSNLRAPQQSEAGLRRLVEKSRTATESQPRIRLKEEGKSSGSLQNSDMEKNKEIDELYLATSQVDTRKSQLLSENLDSDVSYLQSSERLQQQKETLKKEENKNTSLVATEEVKRLRKESSRKSQHHSENLGSDASFLQSSERLQQQEETLKKQEENRNTSLVATEEVKRLRKETSGKMTKDIGSSKVFHTNIGESRIHSSNLEINSQSTSDKHVHNEDTYSKLKLKSVEEIVEKRKWIDETVVQSTHRTEVQRPSTGHFSEEATITQPSVPSNSQTEGQQSSGKEVMSGQLLVTSPPYRHVSRVSQFPEVSSSAVRNDMGRAAKVGSDSTPEHAQASSPSSYGELNLSRKKSSYSPEHTLVSATRMEESSSLFVVEFVEKMSHEISTSDTAVEKESSNTDPKHLDKYYMLKRSTQLDPEDALNSAAHMQESSSLIFGEFAEKMSQETSKSETNIEKKVSKVNTKIQSKNSMTQGSSQLDADKTDSQKHVSDYSFVVSGPDFGKTMSHKLDSKRSSGDFETNEPLDQMWDVKDHFVQESPEIEALEGATSESIVHARTAKSLWNTVTGALRLRWGSYSENQTSPVKRQSSPSESKKSHVKRQSSPSESKKSPVKRQSSSSESQKSPVKRQSSSSESQKSPVKRQSSPSESQRSPVKKQSSPSRSGSGETWSPVKRQSSSSESQKSPVKRQSSPSESQKSPVKRQSSPSSGETWFSENEADNGAGMKTEEISLLQESSSNQSLLGTTKSQKDDVLVMSLDGQSSHVDVGALSSSIQSSSPSGVAFAGENISLNVAQQVSDPSALVDLSTPSRRLRRSFAFEEDDGTEKTEAPTSSSDEQRDSLIDVRQTDDSASGETDVELKSRKLQRSKVIIQRYDDWEDAYRREHEQRKVDEIFMREALSEAIKAADSWEVPVGAVLVQNGKIIGRGYNLVEELRDSTAHAEMLCIKEASNILRTWRLSETTLYVTLEPCPMCAGAILQARISTLVWGAPNKLLGADGSWIRLFPAGAEGEENSEAADKPAAPVHPFHPNMKIRRGILEDECADIMQQFFQLRRRKAKEKKAETSSSEESVQPSCFPRPHQRPRLLHKMHNVFHPSKQRND